jgi:Ca2+-binding RTX toxin-like protein
MNLSQILNSLTSQGTGRRRSAPVARSAQVETFECKELLSASALFLPATGELNIQLNSGDNVRVSSVNGFVRIDASLNGGPTQQLTSIGNTSSANVQRIVVLGGDDANVIDLSSVTAAGFPSLTSILVDGANGDDLLIGSPDFADSIIGGHGADTILGGGGNDTLLGGDGNDSVDGGAGDDSINAGDGDDLVNGGTGNDSILAGNGQDTVNGGDGNDTISGANGQDVLNGDAGDDFLNGDGGADTINGGDGNDSILGGEFDDSLLGGNGDDTINGQAGADTLQGEAGNDLLSGGAGNDRVDGGFDNDTLNGNLGDDTMNGGEGNDSLQGGAGDDSLNGGFGNDRIFGQAGDDTLLGGGDSDFLDGGEGNDSVQSADVAPAGLPTLTISDAVVTEADSLFFQLYNAPNDVPVTDDNEDVIAADFDNDGDIDLATPASILLNVGNGTFAPAVPTGSTAQGRMAVGDLNGDGFLDIAIAGNSTGDVDLLINNGDGTFQAPRTAVDLGTFFSTSSVTMGDFDGDGDLDLAAVVGFATPEVFVMLNNGNGTFQPAQQFAAGTDGASDIVAGDFDGDGNIDIAVAKVFFQSQVAILRNLGNGVFATPVLIAVNDEPSSIVAADFDNDGDLDLATGGDTTTVLLNNGTGTFTASAPIANTGFFTSTNDIAVGDMDQDGDIDIAGVAFSGQITLLENNGAGGFAAAGPATLTTGQGFGTGIVLADLTGDGAPEIAVNDGFAQDNVSIFLNTGATPPVAVFTVSLSAPSAVPVTVAFTTVNGFAQAGSDYLAQSGTLTFAPGVTSQTIQVVIVGDSIGEPTENFFVNLSAPTNATLADAQGQGLILDNDGAPAGVTMNITNAAVTEGDTGTVNAVVSVTLSAPVATPVTVQFNSVDGTATAGVDYVAVSGTLTFAPGVTTQIITVPVIGDLRNEGNETFFINLSNPTGVPASNTQAQVTIIDNDAGQPVLSPNDTLLGGNGDDTLVGSIGDDVLNGQAGNDSILGGDGNDALSGGAGNDTLDGQAGNDTLDGQGGNDVLIGGDGDDVFVLGNGAGGHDTVDGGDGFNSITVNGTGNADTISVGQVSNQLVITRGTATITASANVQSVTVNALGGDDTVTVGDLAGVPPTALTINGGDGNDLITANGANIGRVRLLLSGENGNDTILGSNGNDTILGGNGNDAVNGGAGNDSLLGQAGNDTLAGGLGNDTLSGGEGLDFLTGNEGDDLLDGGAGNDTLRGMDGNDTLLGQAGDDVLNGMDGDDSISGGVGRDQISGGAGDDTLDGGRNDDTINGNSGNDKIRGDHGNDLINAGTGSDTVNGGDGHDTIIATDGGDILNGGDGNDSINAGAGDDILVGGDGNDTLLGGGGNDILLGGDGDDVLNGQGGTDTIAGNQGNDVIADPASEIDEQFTLSDEILALLDAA